MHFSVFTYPLIRVKHLRLCRMLYPHAMQSAFRHLFRSGFPVFFLLLCAFLFLQACVRERAGECMLYNLTVSAVDPQGNDVTASGAISTVDIYLFDENGFVRTIPRGSSTNFSFAASRDSKYTLIAWGNLKGDSLKLPQLTVGTSLENARIELLQSTLGRNLPVTDLFYSRRELSATSTKSIQNDTVRLVMERLVAGLSVDVLHAAEHFGVTNDKMQIVVRSIGSSLNFLAEPSEDEAGYAPSMSRVGDKDEWLAPLFRVFPTNADKQISIDLYRDDTLLFTITTDDDGNPLRTLPGKETYITVDFRYARLRVSVNVVPWGSGSNQNVGL